MSTPITPDKKILEILISLEHTSAFLELLKYLEARSVGLGKNVALLIPDHEVRQAQGQIFELEEILDLYKSRHAILDKLTAVPDNKGRTIL